MKKILLGIAAVLGVGVLGFVGTVSMQPDVLVVERTVKVTASTADVMPEVTDLKAFVTWSPWTGRDPSQKVEYSEPSGGEGAWYTWSGNDAVGSGKMSVASVGDMGVEYDLEFITPFAGKAKVPLTIKDAGGGELEVTWGYEQDLDFAGKAMGLFMDMDAMLGGDFNQGLTNLKGKAEAAAVARVEAEKKAAAEKVAAEKAAVEQGAADDQTAGG